MIDNLREIVNDDGFYNEILEEKRKQQLTNRTILIDYYYRCVSLNIKCIYECYEYKYNSEIDTLDIIGIYDYDLFCSKKILCIPNGFDIFSTHCVENINIVDWVYMDLGTLIQVSSSKLFYSSFHLKYLIGEELKWFDIVYNTFPSIEYVYFKELNSITQNCFLYKENLRIIHIESLGELNDSLLNGCNELKEVYLGKGLSYINPKVFSLASNPVIYYEGDREKWMSIHIPSYMKEEDYINSHVVFLG